MARKQGEKPLILQDLPLQTQGCLKSRDRADLLAVLHISPWHVEVEMGMGGDGDDGYLYVWETLFAKSFQ